MTIDYGPPRDDAELRVYVETAFPSLVGTPMPAESGGFETWKSRTLPYGRARIVRSDGRFAAGMIDLDLAQFYGGRSVPMAGVSFVATAPDHRDRGHAKAMMRAVVREIHARGGAPISALFPATQPLYRSAGFELGGWFARQRVSMHALHERAGDLRPRKIEPADHEPIRAIYTARAARTNGMIDRSPWNWTRVFEPWRGGPTYGYVVESNDGIEGYVVFTQKPLDSGLGYALNVLDMQATNERGHRAILALLGGHRSLATHFVFACAPNDPFLALLAEQETRGLEWRIDWMLRIVDLPRALTARGWPRGTHAELDLEVTDALIPENAGRWKIEIRGGEAHVQRGGSGAVRLDVRALASLYTGYLSAFDLRRSGKLVADEAALEAAAIVFANGAPWMNEMF